MIKIVFHLQYSTGKEADMVIASCSALDVHSQGYTEEEAVKNLDEALYLFLKMCFEMGTLNQVLKESGFNKVGAPCKLQEKYLAISLPQ